jgi:hypothetical protein
MLPFLVKMVPERAVPPATFRLAAPAPRPGSLVIPAEYAVEPTVLTIAPVTLVLPA